MKRLYILFLANGVCNNPSPLRQVASAPTFEQIVSHNEENRFESEYDEIFLNDKLKTKLPSYEEALLM